RYAWLKESTAIEQIWRSTMRMLTELAVSFLPRGVPDEPDPDPALLERWRQRYRAALVRLRQAGIQTLRDEHAGEEIYLALRARWDRYLRVFSDHMAHNFH